MNIDEFLMRLKSEYKNMLIDCNTKKVKSENETQKAKRRKRWLKIFETAPLSYDFKMMLACACAVCIFAMVFSITLPFWPIFGIAALFSGTIVVLEEIFPRDDSSPSENELRSALAKEKQIEKEREYIKNLINNISYCKDYYTYVLPDELKSKPITIFAKDVANIPCLPTTILHMFYQGRFDEFLRLSNKDKIKLEQELNLVNIIETEKKAKFGLIPSTEPQQTHYLQNVRMVGQTERKIDRVHK